MQGLSPFQSGLRILPWTAMPMLVAPIAGAVSDRIGGQRLMGAGLTLQAIGLVGEFFNAVSEELPTWGGTHVKTIGDALMLRIPDPAKAVLLGLRITHELLRGHGAPAVRVGLHHGAAIERDGDYFGAAVNLAARVAAVAIGREVLITAHAASLAPALGGVFYEARGRLPIDPVCQMAADRELRGGRPRW